MSFTISPYYIMLDTYSNKATITNTKTSDIVKEFVKQMHKAGMKPNEISYRLQKRYNWRWNVHKVITELTEEESGVSQD